MPRADTQPVSQTTSGNDAALATVWHSLSLSDTAHDTAHISHTVSVADSACVVQSGRVCRVAPAALCGHAPPRRLHASPPRSAPRQHAQRRCR
eukprot:2587434-Rhodomonas_salina.1